MFLSRSGNLFKMFKTAVYLLLSKHIRNFDGVKVELMDFGLKEGLYKSVASVMSSDNKMDFMTSPLSTDSTENLSIFRVNREE